MAKVNRTILFWLPWAMVLAVGCIIEPTPTTEPRIPVGTPTPTPAPAAVSTPTALSIRDAGRTGKRYAQPPPMTIDSSAMYTATIVTNKGEITLELFASESPVTVNNFVFLAQEGFYDGVLFHRVMKNFMIQTGDPTGTGSGNPGYRFADEPVTRSYEKGIVAMANSGPNTNGSQFFIVHGTNAGLRPLYTIFGEVTEGIDTVDQIANAPVRATARGELSSPIEPLIVQTIRINQTNGS